MKKFNDVYKNIIKEDINDAYKTLGMDEVDITEMMDGKRSIKPVKSSYDSQLNRLEIQKEKGTISQDEFRKEKSKLDAAYDEIMKKNFGEKLTELGKVSIANKDQLNKLSKHLQVIFVLLDELDIDKETETLSLILQKYYILFPSNNHISKNDFTYEMAFRMIQGLKTLRKQFYQIKTQKQDFCAISISAQMEKFVSTNFDKWFEGTYKYIFNR